MPVKLWQRDEDGGYSSKIVTKWDTALGGEEYRREAEELDEKLDGVLDDAIRMLDSDPIKVIDVSIKFKRIWCVGRSTYESGVLGLSALRTEQRVLLWRAMAWKCWLGTRHDYPTSPPEERWQHLRPTRQVEPKNPFRIHDMFETGLWLQQQDIEDAVFTFAGSVSSAREIGLRTSINALAMRNALKQWLQGLTAEQRALVHKNRNFPEVAKALRKRWPDKGPGSARRPEHQPPQELLQEVRELLAPLVSDFQADT